MSRRLFVRAVAFLVFAFLVMFAMTAENIQRTKRYEQVISDNYYYAFSELLTGITKLDYALEKCIYSGDDSMLCLLCAEVYREAEISSRALSQLPVSELSLENISKFITQTGDYAYYISKKAARGEGVLKAELNKIAELSAGADALMNELRIISSNIKENSINLAEVDFSDSESNIIGDIKELEREFSEYPVLIYDGPFSDETDGENQFLMSLDKTDESTALYSASRFLNISADELQYQGVRNEKNIELYTFANDKYNVDVTVQGGIVYRVISSKYAQTSKINVQDAINNAKKVLADAEFTNLRETYYMKYGNTVNVNFASFNNDTVIYPDLIKVTVSLEDGSIINADTAGYIRNRKQRSIPDISHKRAAAKEKVSKDLKILSYSPAIIPTDGVGEVLTHEFKCENKNGEHCIVYINADTLHEEKILVLIEDENGTLVM
ncbi:MAG: germination protein YpeB [Oscillospiraceae bacterium]|nr:germination protein YpeB [Oscillospiraceae bacterium]